MKKLKLFLSEFIEPGRNEKDIVLDIVFLITGAILAWIYFIYFTHWVSILHSHFAPSVQIPKDLLPTNLQEDFQPEPLELPLYLTGCVFIPVFTFINYVILKLSFNKVQNSKLKIQNSRIIDFTKHIFLTLLILSLGTCIFLYKGRGKLWILNISLLVTVTGFLLSLLNLKINKWVILGFEFIVTTSIICLLLFDPTLSFNAHHYNYYLGPVNDVLHGKTMLVDTSCQYGMLVIYFLSFLFKCFLPVTYKAFSFLIFLISAIYYVGLYFFIRYWLKSYLIAILGLFLILLFNYSPDIHWAWVFAPDVGPALYPMTGPLRFGIFLIILALFLVKNKYIDYFILFLIAFSLFWGVEVGIYIILAVFLAYIISYFSDIRHKTSDIRKILKDFGLKLLILTISIVFIGGIISLFTYVRSGQVPKWQLLYGDALLYKSGCSMMPIPPIGPYYLVLMIYFVALVYLFINILIKNGNNGISLSKINDIKIVSFITFFGIFQFIYYVGRSHPQNLYHVCIPAIMLLVWFIPKIKEYLLKYTGPQVGIVSATLVLISISMGICIGSELNNDWSSVVSDYRKRYNFIKQNTSGIMNFDETDSDILMKAKLIKEIIPDEAKIALISDNDTRILINAGKTNLMNFYTISKLITVREVKECAGIFNRVKPDYLFMEDGHYTRNFLEYLDLKDYVLSEQRTGLKALKNKNCKKTETVQIEGNEKIIIFYSDSAEFHIKLGDRYSKYVLLDDAIKEYKEALRLNPDYPEV